jgi:hypothetical protein
LEKDAQSDCVTKKEDETSKIENVETEIESKSDDTSQMFTISPPKAVESSIETNIESNENDDTTKINDKNQWTIVKSKSKKNNNNQDPLEDEKDEENNSKKQLPYFSGNPTVDLVKGFIHIYKDYNMVNFDDPTSVTNENYDSPQSEMICMIGIPASITCHELLDFVMPFSDTMQYLRIIRDANPNQYMALLKFNTPKDAHVFYVYNNNKLFNSIEETVCNLVFVERIETLNSSKGASLPLPGFAELPTCYICLERMDESLNGVITVLCNHSFHAKCLSKWSDTCCPVCRYVQTPDCSVESTCSECGTNEVFLTLTFIFFFFYFFDKICLRLEFMDLFNLRKCWLWSLC